VYGKSQPELLHEFLRERGSADTDMLQLTELKEFALSRVEAAARRRHAPEPEPAPAPTTPLSRAQRRRAAAAIFGQ
jgi:hypothetical protein